MPSLRVVTDGRAGLAGPLCNYGLGRDGTVYVVAAGYGWHAGVVRDQSYANDYAIGIEAEATGLTGWPSIQMDAYAQLCAALCDAFDLSPDRVLGHKEVCAPRGRKSDPNFDMDQFRTRVRNAPGLDQEEDRMAAFTQLDLEKAAQKGAEKALNALRFEDPDDPGKEINLQTALRRLLKDGNPA
jgi:N-acetyl-anhydromuramyl-L-alanine amidase AmpD